MKYLLMLALFITGCSETSSIGKCYTESIQTYSYKVYAIGEDYYITDATGKSSTLDLLNKEVSCDIYEADKLWFKVKNDIDILKNKVNVLEGNVK